MNLIEKLSNCPVLTYFNNVALPLKANYWVKKQLFTELGIYCAIFGQNNKIQMKNFGRLLLRAFKSTLSQI